MKYPMTFRELQYPVICLSIWNILIHLFFFFIKNFDKELAGSYKVKFCSNDGENSATFTVKAGSKYCLPDP